MKLDLFDCNAQIGRFGKPVHESFFAPGELVDRLAPLGIRRALVYHALSKELHPAEGNPALAGEIAGLPLVGCWVAMPHHTGEMPPPAEFVRQMRAAEVRAVRLFPGLHQYSLGDWCSGELLDELERSRVPVLIEAGQTSYDQIASVLASHPGLRIVLLQTSYRCDRFIYPLLEKHEHLHIETSTYVVSGGIEAICSRFGASRLVFGTCSPFHDPGAAVGIITYADISDTEKQLIASGNLDRLLGWE